MNNEAKPIQITVYHSWESGNAKNCRYPNAGVGSTPKELKALFCYDHTFIRFKNSYRSIDNFEEVAVAAADIDNDHSDDPGKCLPAARANSRTPGESLPGGNSAALGRELALPCRP